MANKPVPSRAQQELAFGAVLFLATIPLQVLAFQSYQIDFRVIYTAIQSFLAGYDPYLNQAVHGAAYSDVANTSLYSRLVYPPMAFLALLPFGLSHSYVVCKTLWAGFLSISLVGLLVYLRRKHPISDRWFLLAAMSLPVVTNFERGQIYIVLVLLLVVAYHQRHSFWAGLWLALAIHFRIAPVFILLYFLLRGHTRALGGTLTFSGLLGLVSLLAGGATMYANVYRNCQNLFHSVPLEPLGPVLSGPAMPVLVQDLLVQTPEGVFFFSQFAYFLNSKINFLTLISGEQGAVLGLSVALMAVFLALSRRHPESPMLYYAFLVLLLLLNVFSYVYAMVFYIPFYVAAVERHSNRPILTVLLALPLFCPAFLAIDDVTVSCLLAVMLIGYVVFLPQKDTCKTAVPPPVS